MYDYFSLTCSDYCHPIKIWTVYVVCGLFQQTLTLWAHFEHINLSSAFLRIKPHYVLEKKIKGNNNPVPVAKQQNQLLLWFGWSAGQVKYSQGLQTSDSELLWNLAKVLWTIILTLERTDTCGYVCQWCSEQFLVGGYTRFRHSMG